MGFFQILKLGMKKKYNAFIDEVNYKISNRLSIRKPAKNGEEIASD